MSDRPSLSGTRALVTGATGLVGSWLVKRLVEDAVTVVALVLDDDRQSELYRSGAIDHVAVVSGNLLDIASIERAIAVHEVDTVFHLGAQTIVGAARRAPLETLEVNVRGTYQLLEVCRRHPDLVRRVVVASSDKAYGSQALPYTEESPLEGRHPYDVSKSCADLIAQCYHHSFGLPVAIARCGNVYGGGDLNWSRLVPGTIRDCLHGRRPVVRSDGTCLRDYLFVEDVVDAYIALARGLDRTGVAGQAFNFGDESPASVLEMVAAITQAMGCEHLEPDVRNDTSGEIAHQTLSATKAQQTLGWRPRFTRSLGLAKTIHWYRQFFGADRPIAAIV